MQIKNSEIKAKTNRPEEIKKILLDLGAVYKGCDHQVDTYFNVKSGRLKLRSGNIENSLIHYNRDNNIDPTLSNISFSKVTNAIDIKDVLTNSLGVLIEVIKDRHIYFINHVKFHVDFLEKLGNFVEIEVIDLKNEYSESEMHELCRSYMKKLGIKESELLTHSYSDMLQIL